MELIFKRLTTLLIFSLFILQFWRLEALQMLDASRAGYPDPSEIKSGLASTGDDPTHLDALTNELTTCTWNHLVVMWTERQFNEKLMETFLTFVRRLHIPLTLYRVTVTNVAGIVYKEYVERLHTNFVLMSEDTDLILKEVDSLYRNYSRRTMAAFVHRTNWLLVKDGPQQLAAPNCDLDHVASIDVGHQHTGLVRTLMWRDGRLRQWDVVNLNGKESSECVLYPNKAHGMNGRALIWLAKDFDLGSRIATNSMGEREYSGMLVDLVQLMKTILNFTLILHPPAALGHKMKASEFETVLLSHSIDVGLDYYSLDVAMLRNLSGTYPIIIDKTVAAYIHDSRVQTAKMKILGTTATFTPQTIVMSFFYSVLFYKALTVLIGFTNQCADIGNGSKEFNPMPENIISKQDENVWGTDNIGHNSDLDVKPHNSGETDICTTKTGHILKVVRICSRVTVNFPNFHMFRFFGAHVNQGTMMRPKSTPLRLFVFFWCIYVLVITNLFTGTLTAGFIKPKIHPPFTSVSQILQSTETKYGTFYSTELVQKSANWTIDGDKWKGNLINFSLDFSTTPRQFLNFMKENSKKPKVFVYYETQLLYFKYKSNFTDLYITKKSFQTSPLGLACPPYSELADYISPTIVWMHEVGALWKLTRPYVGDVSREPDKMDKQLAAGVFKRDVILFLSDFFYVVVGCIFLAVSVLGIEAFVYHCTPFYNG